MTTEDYLDKALKYATERYDERHYEDEATTGLYSDWGVDYEGWVELFADTQYYYLLSDASTRGGTPRDRDEFLANPLHKMVIEAAKILVKEKGL